MDIRWLAINNCQKVVRAFKEILSDLATGPEFEAGASNIISDFFGLESFNNIIPNIPGLELSIFTPKIFFNTNIRLSNSQKKKAT